jgi:nucleoside-diphosphate-sugar epimerase
MKRICIIGLGWLGESLAHFYMAQGYEVIGTASTQEKAKSLSQDQLKVIPFSLSTKPQILIQQLDLSSFDFLVLTIPPSALKTAFAKQLIGLIQAIRTEQTDLPLLYTSSTSVYGDQSGKLNEASILLPKTNNAHELVKVERFMLDQLRNTYVLRLGGLVGGQRHPVHYLKGRTDLSKPKAEVNLVHRLDVIRAIDFIEKNKLPFGVYNLVTPEHPNRADFYTKVAEKLQLSLPTFEASNQASGKVIVSSKISKHGFKFEYQSPFDFPESKAL